MGEMADLAIEQGIYSLFVEENNSDWPAPDEGTMCMYCRKGPFYWIETSCGWRLSDGKGKIHCCKSYRDKVLKRKTPLCPTRKKALTR